MTALSRKLGIAEEDKFSMLQAIGGDCAGAVSLYPPDIDILKVRNTSLYAVKRYDSKTSEQGVVRLVQEDFCQAMNRNSQQKYNYSLKDCFDLIRRECSNPIEDSRRLFNLVLFNGSIEMADK